MSKIKICKIQMLNYESGVVFRDGTFCSEFFGGFLKSFFKLSLYGIVQVSLSNNIILKIKRRTSMVVQWLRLSLPMQRVRGQSLVRELGSHMPHSQRTRTQNKRYCDKFNKNLRNDPHQKMSLKKLKRKIAMMETVLDLKIRFQKRNGQLDLGWIPKFNK